MESAYPMAATVAEPKRTAAWIVPPTTMCPPPPSPTNLYHAQIAARARSRTMGPLQDGCGCNHCDEKSSNAFNRLCHRPPYYYRYTTRKSLSLTVSRCDKPTRAPQADLMPCFVACETDRGRTKWTGESVLQSSHRNAHKITEA